MKRKYSLKRKKEFRYVYKSGKSVACKSLVLIYKRNNKGLLRIGLSVSKKIGNSVTRNLFKRRLRAALDKYIPQTDPNYNLIIIARQPITACDFSEICQATEYLLKKAGLLILSENDIQEPDAH